MSTRIGSCEWDPEQRTLSRGNRELPLTRKERDLLAYLAERNDQVVTVEELLQDVWQYAPTVKTRAVQNTVSRLRKKLGTDALQLQTVSGRGYVLATPADSGLVGRDAAVTELQQALARHRAVGLYGFGGVGKTRVARVLRAGFEATTWIDARSVQPDPGDFMARLASQLGVETSRPEVDQLGFVLEERGPMLLVVDAAEHLGSWLVELVTRWCGRATELQVLITSRHAPEGVVTYELGPLVPADAAELLDRRRRAILPAPELSTEQQQELVSVLEGVPLAIELAAARLRVLSANELLVRLRRDATVLDGPERRVQASVEWSWRSLDDDAREVLQAAALFPGTFSVDAVERVAGLPGTRTLDALDLLRRSALVVREGSVLRLLDLVRGHVRERVSPEVRQRLVDHAVEEAQRTVALLRAGDEPPDEVFAERSRLWVAAVDDARGEDRAWLVVALHIHDRIYGPLLRTHPMLEQLDPGALPDPLAARVLHRASYARVDADERPEGLRLIRQAVERARRADDKGLLVEVMTWEAACVRFVEGPAAALPLAEALVEMSDAPGINRYLRYRSLSELNANQSQLGRYAESHRSCLRMLPLVEGHVETSAEAHDALGFALYQCGRMQEAIAELRTALEFARRRRRRRRIAQTALRLGEILLVDRQDEEARKYLEEARAAAEVIQSSHVMFNARIKLALYEEPETKITSLEAVREHALAVGRVREAGVAAGQVAFALHDAGELGRARAAYEQALAILDEIGWANPADQMRAACAVLLAELGEVDAALELLAGARSGSVVTRQRIELADAAVRGDVDRFRAVLAERSEGERRQLAGLLAYIVRLDPRLTD